MIQHRNRNMGGFLLQYEQTTELRALDGIYFIDPFMHSEIWIRLQLSCSQSSNLWTAPFPACEPHT